MKHNSDNLTASCSTPNGGFEIGDVVRVGEYFWISKYEHIGFDSDAQHAGVVAEHPSGSVDTDCRLTIRGFETWRGDDVAIVRLDRKLSPRGDMAPRGQVCAVSISQMQKWPEMLKKVDAHERERKALVKKYVV